MDAIKDIICNEVNILNKDSKIYYYFLNVVQSIICLVNKLTNA